MNWKKVVWIIVLFIIALALYNYGSKFVGKAVAQAV